MRVTCGQAETKRIVEEVSHECTAWTLWWRWCDGHSGSNCISGAAAAAVAVETALAVAVAVAVVVDAAAAAAAAL
jgi:hypothetical protein